jgi:Fe-S cluster assembly protein SufD
MTKVHLTEEPGLFSAEFRDFVGSVEAGRAGAQLQRLRREAFSRFEHLGLPSPRQEDWKYTNVAGLKKHRFALGPGDEGVSTEVLQGFTFSGLECQRLVFVNGRFRRELSLAADAPGLEVSSLADVLRSEPGLLAEHLGAIADSRSRPFVALNTAFLADGVFVRLRRGRKAELPVHLLFIAAGGAAPTASHPRSLVIVEEGAELVLLEDYVSLGAATHFTNAVTEIAVGQNAHLDHYRVLREDEGGFHISAVALRQARSSRFASHAFSLGGGLVRNDIDAALDGEGVDCVLNGLTVASKSQHIDNHTRIDHLRPHGSSRELYKAVLDGRAEGVFNGKIFVAPEAQKTDAKQTNQALLLSTSASMESKPELEIYADDVKCTHGATVGQLDAEALFYLRTRGLDAERARSLLTYAFASDIVDQVQLEAVRHAIERLLYDKLPKGVRLED